MARKIIYYLTTENLGRTENKKQWRAVCVKEARAMGQLSSVSLQRCFEVRAVRTRASAEHRKVCGWGRKKKNAPPHLIDNVALRRRTRARL